MEERIAEADAAFEIEWARFRARSTPKLQDLLKREPIIKLICAMFHSHGTRWMGERMEAIIKHHLGEDPRSAPDTKGPTT